NQGVEPGQPAEPEVQRREGEYHEERRCHERDSYEGRAQDAATHPAEVDGELGCERAGGKLREREPLLVVVRRDPATLVHEVALHVTRERDRSAEPQRAELEEVEDELPARGSGPH